MQKYSVPQTSQQGLCPAWAALQAPPLGLSDHPATTIWIRPCYGGRRNVAVRDCNPGLLFQSRDFGIEKCQSRVPGIESPDWVPDFELVKISSNSLVLVSWWVLESWSICWSPVLTYYYVNNCKYFNLSSFLSSDTISLLFNVKRNLLILSRFKIAMFFFVFKVVKIVKFSAIIGPLLLINSSN